MTRYPFTLTLLAGLLALGIGCVRDRDNSGDTRSEIEETKDRAAEQRAKLEKKNDELATSGEDTSSERRRFADATDKKLRELDQKITSLRSEIQARAVRVGGEERGDLEAQLRDLDSARAQAQVALDSFRQEGASASTGQDDTQDAVNRTGAAYDALHGRIRAGDPTTKPVEPEKK
jgi:chromosome segregation ATPase